MFRSLKFICVSITRTNQLMLFREMTDIYSQNLAKSINTKGGILNVIACGSMCATSIVFQMVHKQDKKLQFAEQKHRECVKTINKLNI
jgi:hypothetical protein